jgi:hypothetical protein
MPICGSLPGPRRGIAIRSTQSLYTDGAQYLAEAGGGYGLLDKIAIIQPYDECVAAEEFQVWMLAVPRPFLSPALFFAERKMCQASPRPNGPFLARLGKSQIAGR